MTTTIQPEQLSAPHITIPGQQTPDHTGSFVAGLQAGQKSLDSYIKTLTPAPTQAEGQQQGILNDLASLTKDSTGRQAYQIEQENQFGIPDFQKKIADYSTQVNIGIAELNKLDADELQAITGLDNQGYTSSAYYGRQAQIKRQTAILKTAKAAEIGLKQAVIAGLTGQLDVASRLVTRAVDLKYKPIEDEIKIKQAQLQAIQPILNKEERVQALAQEQILRDQERELQDKKENERLAKTFSIENNIQTPYYQIGGTIYRTSDGKPYTSPEAFFKDGGAMDFSGVTVVDQARNQEQQLIVEYANKYPDAGISLRDSLGIAQQKILKSRIYQDQVRPPSSGGGGGNLGVLGLTNQQIDNISPLVTQFQSSPIVQNYNTIGEGYTFVKSLSNDTKNPADDQALVYALAKALDPGSVVREGEYNTVQKYAQSWVQSYGKSVTQALNGTGFLSNDARKNIKATIESRYKAAETSYNNLYSETARRINLIGSTDKGSQLLNNYGGAFAPSVPYDPPNPNAGNTSVMQPAQPAHPAKQGFWRKTYNWLFGE